MGKCGLLVGENTNKGICICNSCVKDAREHKQQRNNVVKALGLVYHDVLVGSEMKVKAKWKNEY